MANLTGILAVVFVLVGVFVLLGAPTVLNCIFQWRFSKRFERLVRQGHLVPIFTRPDNENEKTYRPTPRRKRVTMESFVDAWIGRRPHAQRPAHATSSARGWKPLAAAFISRQDERPVTSSILTNKAQKKEAKQFLETFRYQRRAVGALDVQLQAKEHQKERPLLAEANSEAPQHTAGKLRFSTLILMPSKLHPHFRSEAGAITSTSGSESPPGLYPRTLAESFEHLHEGEDGSDGRPRGMQTLSAMEIGVAEQNLDQASDILELVGDDEGEDDNNRASVVSLGDEEDFNEMIRVLAANTPVTRYPIMYGRPYVITRPMYMNPLLPARTRVY